MIDKEIINKLNDIYNKSELYKKDKKVYIEILKRSCTCLVISHPEKMFIIKCVL